MSRHLMRGFNPTFEIVVGYDAPLDTYFAQVVETSSINNASNISVESDERRTILWIGTSWEEILDVQIIAQKLQSFADVSPELLAELENDRRLEARPPTALQAEMRVFSEYLADKKN